MACGDLAVTLVLRHCQVAHQKHHANIKLASTIHPHHSPSTHTMLRHCQSDTSIFNPHPFTVHLVSFVFVHPSSRLSRHSTFVPSIASRSRCGASRGSIELVEPSRTNRGGSEPELDYPIYRYPSTSRLLQGHFKPVESTVRPFESKGRPFGDR